ncbi:MAG: N-acetylmuramoyl-L-alanine amidase [Bacteroidia bacterium]
MQAKLIKVIYMAKYIKTMPNYLFWVICFLLCSFKAKNPTFKTIIQTIVIDAGHGGHDPGAQYFGVKEKDVTLKIALALGKKIEQKMPEVRIVYTRKTDKFVGLYERAGIANKNNADLFISIHCNSSKNPIVAGSETYTMGLHKSDGNLEVAKRENQVITLEDNYQETYGGFDPNSPESHIYFTLFQNAYIEHSLKLAAKIENNFAKNQNISSRGVKQAGFMVLWQTKMPSVLIEVGFLSNKKENDYLNSEDGVNQIAQNISTAILEYKRAVEGGTN